MEFRLLGPLEVEDPDKVIPLGGLKQRAVLALLLLDRGRAVSTDRLIDEVWTSEPPQTAAKSVQVYISGLRKVLGEGRIVTRDRGYELQVQAGETDADQFDALVRTASEAAPGEAAQLLQQALGLVRGRPLEDVSLGPWAAAEVARLEERILAATEARIDAELALGQDRALVPELDQLVAEFPFQERFLEQLMLALYRSGRQTDALDVYRRGAARLRDELGLEPGRPLRDLEAAVLRHDPNLDLDTAADRPLEERVPRRRRASRLAIAASIAAVAATTAATVAVIGHSADTNLPPVASASVGVIDPTSNHVLGGVPVGRGPSSIAFGDGEIWVLNGDDRTLSRIDARSRRVLRTIAVGGTPTDLAIGAGSVWVSDRFEKRVTRIDADSGIVTDTIGLPGSGEGVPISVGSGGHVTFSQGAVWVTMLLEHGFVWRIDPHRNAVVETIRLRPGLGGDDIALGEGAVWVNGNGGVTRIDLRSQATSVLSAIEPGGVGGVAVGGGSVWVAGVGTGSENDVLWRIDPRREFAAASLPVGAGPSGVAARAGSIWVANRLEGTVSRIDPKTNEVVATIRVGGGAPRDIAVGAGSVWVSVG